MKDSMILTDWMGLPPGMEAPGALYVLGDVHGAAHLLAPILDWIGAEAFGDDAESDLVFLGDLIDRGAEGLRCLKLATGRIPGVRTTILPGNHEIAMLRFLAGHQGAWDSWRSKGAESVVAEVHDLDQPVSGRELRRLVRAAMPLGFERRLLAGPTCTRHGSFLMLHAGVDPAAPAPENWLQTGLFEGDPTRHWSTITDDFNSWTGGWENYGAGAVVHGHMPIMDAGWTEAVRTAHERLFSHRRLTLDFGCGFLDRLGGAQIRGSRIRYFGCGSGQAVTQAKHPVLRLLPEICMATGELREAS